MDKNKSIAKMRYTGQNIWIVVLILLIAVMLSLMLLTPSFSKLSKSDSNVISLIYEGDRELLDKDGFSYISGEAKPDMVAYDNNVQWETNTDVDLFKTAYANDNGEITVNSKNNEKVIAPGTSNEYEFFLKNTGNVSLDYTMVLDSVFTLLDRDMPIKIRLRRGDKWILGNENRWVEPENLSKITESGRLEVNKKVSYIFEWQWPFEDNIDGDLSLNDINDTIIGNVAVNKDVLFNLSITTESKVPVNAIPVNVKDDEIAEPLVLLSDLSEKVFCPSSFVFVFLLILLIFLRKPILVTGFVSAVGGEEIKIGRKKSQICEDGRFIFKRIYSGKHCFVLGEKKCSIKLKYKSKTEGIVFDVKDDRLIITVSRKVRAIELYMFVTDSKIVISQDNWAVIDKKRNVITPSGVKEPEDKQNTTPGGLHINERGYFEIVDVSE